MLDRQKNTGAEHPYLANANVRWGSFDLSELKTTRFSASEEVRFSLLPGDLLLCEGGEPGRCAIWREEKTDVKYQKALHRIRSKYILPEFLALYFEAIAKDEWFQRLFTGSTIKHLPLERVEGLPFPLPPHSEQQAIIFRFQVLSSLCKSIDEDSTLLSDLAKTTKNRVLDLAIRGALVPQVSLDEPASTLLERIRSTADKPPCPKKGKKREATIGDVLDPPFLIPESWAWTTLGDVAELVLGGTPDTHDSKCWGGDIPWLTPGEMSDIKGKYVSDTRRKLTRTGLEKASRMFPSRSVILSTRAPIGYLFINTVPMCTNQGCKTIVPKCGVLAEYLYYNLLGRVPELQSLGTGTTFKELSSGKLASLPLSLPPLAEQRRIVAKVDEMFATIDGMLG